MFLTVFLAFALGFNSIFPTSSQSGSTIAGFVFDSQRRPLADLYVELLTDTDSTLMRTRTDGAGRYSFTRLQRGNYQVRVVTGGTNYIGQTQRIELIVVSASAGSGRAYEELSFVLKTVDEVNAKKLGGSGIVFSQNIPVEAQRLYEDAVEKLKSENTTEGLADLKKAIETFPDYYLALERLGAEYVKLRDYAQAQEVLAKALKVNPKGHMSLHSLGVVQYNLKNFPAAVESLQRAVALAPSSINSQFWLGIVLFRSGKFSEAETPLKRAYELGGKQVVDVHMYLAQVYSNTKRYKEAADELELFLKETPEAKDAEKIRGLIQTLRAKATQ
jgi:tetratricopeptide (TPR) repeat protein